MKRLLILPLLLVMAACASPDSDILARQYVADANARTPYVMDVYRATGASLIGEDITFRYEYRGAEISMEELLKSEAQPEISKKRFKEELKSICSRHGALNLLADGYSIHMLFLNKDAPLTLPVDYNTCRQAIS
ncbi:hypothetical protein [Sneathiella sp.]|uniref:hypothetical protein n=1 Tax=Sneathiella sp. TaxID=1964365 RepID=UPI00261682BA|nr:hypothetical protein [Sneathiella sp.]MDF2366317.1 hypothetical protein [Sneathiella sp.]